MSQDIIADALNEIMNAKRSKKKKVIIDRHSDLMLKVFNIARKDGYIEDYNVEKRKVEITIGNLSNCRAIKPRFNAKKDKIQFYVKRFLPARNIGIMIVSTNKGVMTHIEAIEKNIGGSLIAYFY